jgi:hypothetical protein
VATKYKVKAGFHNDMKKVYRMGETFLSERPLHKTFPNKFEIVATDVEMPKDEKGSEKKKSKKTRYPKSEPITEFGKDVTQRFSDAINKGLKVWQNEDGEYFVTRENDRYNALNDKPLTKVGTKKFLLKKDWQKEEDDED